MHGKVNMKEGKFVWKKCMKNQTIPNVYFLKKNGIDHNNKPVEWVNIFSFRGRRTRITKD